MGSMMLARSCCVCLGILRLLASLTLPMQIEEWRCVLHVMIAAVQDALKSLGKDVMTEEFINKGHIQLVPRDLALLVWGARDGFDLRYMPRATLIDPGNPLTMRGPIRECHGPPTGVLVLAAVPWHGAMHDVPIMIRCRVCLLLLSFACTGSWYAMLQPAHTYLGNMGNTCMAYKL